MTALPLIRQVSTRVTPWLARTPLSANQVTALSLVLGLGAVWGAAENRPVLAALLLVAAYVLDNCDGEIARLKNQTSAFGRFFDSFVDWIVHAALFAGLGIGASRSLGGDLWLWLGWTAFAGATLNYAIGQYFDFTRPRPDRAPEESPKPQSAGEWLLFAFRELSRADFCFLFLALALFDLAWLLVPAGAIGAQVYWATQFLAAARRFHV
jgi:phosphatidylglycerophosphate synthase